MRVPSLHISNGILICPLSILSIVSMSSVHVQCPCPMSIEVRRGLYVARRSVAAWLRMANQLLSNVEWLDFCRLVIIPDLKQGGCYGGMRTNWNIYGSSEENKKKNLPFLNLKPFIVITLFKNNNSTAQQSLLDCGIITKTCYWKLLKIERYENR